MVFTLESFYMCTVTHHTIYTLLDTQDMILNIATMYLF